MNNNKREIAFEAEKYADLVHLSGFSFKNEDEKQMFLQSNQELSSLYDCSMNGFIAGATGMLNEFHNAKTITPFIK